jgi:serine/threonine protein kinase
VTLGCLLLAQHPLAGALGDAFSNGVDARFWGLVETLRLNDGIEKSVVASQRAFALALAPHCSLCMLDFILRCVNADPAQRPTCSELLRHAFVRPRRASSDGEELCPIVVKSGTFAQLPSPTISVLHDGLDASQSRSDIIAYLDHDAASPTAATAPPTPVGTFAFSPALISPSDEADAPGTVEFDAATVMCWLGASVARR